MKAKREIGSYYTPPELSNFLVEYLSSKIQSKEISVLEPSAGDGSFIKPLLEHSILSKKLKSVVAVERERREANKIRKLTSKKNLKVINKDFLRFQYKNKATFSLVIGNPPYIKKSLLSDPQIRYCQQIHALYPSLSTNIINNIWTAFLLRSIRFVNKNGIIAFILPAEFLQVKFAAELRMLMLSEFERVEIFTFNQLLFKDCKGQDTLIIIGERKSENKGVYYCTVTNLEDLSSHKFSLTQNVRIRESKWTHHHLSSDEIELLERLRGSTKTINHYCSSKAGIVTAANDYFIVNKATIKEFSLQRFVRPIIQKGSFVNGSVVFTETDFNNLVASLKPTYLLALNKLTKFKSNERITKYIKHGVEAGIDSRYKTMLRDKWFEVPNIGRIPEAFFFKRCNEYPKLIKNNAKVLATDSAYSIEMNLDYDLNSLIFSFYNSLTLAYAELHGRYYGGGVLELTPNEFKNLPISLIRVSQADFKAFTKDFKSKESIKEISLMNDVKILKSMDKNLDYDSIQKIFGIREKLYERRIKTN
jgi:adenine-specific DNA-methyltransferase